MVFIITGATCVGKTLLAQRMLEKYNFPYLSIDHLKMGLIRSGNTMLTPLDDDALADYLWPIVKEIIKTAIENKQNLIVEGCYVPFNWRESFNDDYLSSIRFICLAMTREYIINNFEKIKKHINDIESRIAEHDITIKHLSEENEKIINGFSEANEEIIIINDNYEKTINEILISEKLKLPSY